MFVGKSRAARCAMISGMNMPRNAMNGCRATASISAGCVHRERRAQHRDDDAEEHESVRALARASRARRRSGPELLVRMRSP